MGRRLRAYLPLSTISMRHIGYTKAVMHGKGQSRKEGFLNIRCETDHTFSTRIDLFLWNKRSNKFGNSEYLVTTNWFRKLFGHYNFNFKTHISDCLISITIIFQSWVFSIYDHYFIYFYSLVWHFSHWTVVGLCGETYSKSSHGLQRNSAENIQHNYPDSGTQIRHRKTWRSSSFR